MEHIKRDARNGDVFNDMTRARKLLRQTRECEGSFEIDKNDYHLMDRMIAKYPNIFKKIKAKAKSIYRYIEDKNHIPKYVELNEATPVDCSRYCKDYRYTEYFLINEFIIKQ